jgi:NAD(P)H-hydrate epimerase
MDASTGETPGDVARAHVTLTFGSVKRGHLVNREACGTVVVLDIGLAPSGDSSLPRLIDEAWVAAQLPPIAWAAHKGTRKKLAIVGGARGMAGEAARRPIRASKRRRDGEGRRR